MRFMMLIHHDEPSLASSARHQSRRASAKARGNSAAVK
jgi:hypothetical protein